MKTDKKIHRKGILTISWICLAIFATIVALTLEVSKYETSIYNAYPFVAWIAFGFALFGGLVLVLWSASSGQRYGRHGITLILGTYGVFYSLPIVQGYVLYGTPLSDNLYHLGIVKDILRTGRVPDTIYPATHILISELVQITGLSRTLFQPLLAYLFSTVMLILCLFISTQKLFGDRSAGLYVLAAAVPLVYVTYHVVILPWFFALCFLPMILYLAFEWFNSRRTTGYILLLVAAVSIVFYHPLTAVFIAVGLLVYSFQSYIAASSPPAGKGATNILKALITPGVMLLIMFEWNLGLSTMQNKIQRIAFLFLVSQGERSVSVDQAAESKYTLIELIWQFLILKWGPAVLYLGVSGLIMVWIIYRLRGQRTSKAGVVLITQYVTGIGIGIVSYSILFTTNPIRVFQYALLFSIYLIGTGLWILSKRRNTIFTPRFKKVLISSIILVIMTSTVLSVGITYGDDNRLTRSTLEGTQWHLDHQRTGIPTRSIRMSRNLEYYLYGVSKAKRQSPTFNRYNNTRQLPRHIGYATNSTAANTFNNTVYLITKRSDTRWYTDQPKKRLSNLQYYNRSDINEMESDYAVKSIYTNGDFTTWIVNENNESRYSQY